MVESTCNAGELDSVPSLGRSPEEGMATHSSILAWEVHGQESLVGYNSWSHTESDTTEILIREKNLKKYICIYMYNMYYTHTCYIYY